ncbi:MAG: hypothetical protein J6X49_09660 [Victivallales bacterium]|nr:hypothetical protein [Victivallales bacterium]
MRISLGVLVMMGLVSLGSHAAEVPVWNEKGKNYPIPIAGADQTIGQQLIVNAPFTGFAFAMPTYLHNGGSCKLSVFQWAGDFVKTLRGKALHEKVIEGLVDNSRNWLEFPALPAGEYLFLISEPRGSVGCWAAGGEPVSGGNKYETGIGSKGDLHLIIRFEGDTPEKPFGVCAEPAIEIAAAPAEYALPADSRVFTHDVMPDTWAFVDGLGRKSLGYEDVGGPRMDKTLAMFYWTWHVGQGRNCVPQNNQKAIDEHPEAIHDFKHPVWKTGAVKNFWNEPIYGYYLTNDPWVMRRQGELLANAGVDAIFTDNTNNTATWRDSYIPLYKTWMKALEDGVKVPKVSFMLPFAPGPDTREQIKSLFIDIYHPMRYQPLWFYWDGKPMMMAHPECLDSKDKQQDALAKYFTYRPNVPWYVDSNPGLGNWGWLSIYPQAVYYLNQADKDAGRAEQTTVGVAHNHDYKLHGLAAMNGRDIMGRSYTSKGYHREPNAFKYGYNFAEQFDYALKVDPKVLFVTGWNEWIAGRYKEWPEGHKTSVPNAFPDEFSDEFSRDLEPSKGDLKDHYYYQFVNYARRYKGVRPVPTPSAPKSIDINGGFAQWDDVQPYFAAYQGNTEDRDADGYKTCHYTEHSGRNDIVGAKVARDDAFVYFMVECADTITPYTDALWMTLYIDCTENGNGWNGYDYVVNKTAPSATRAVLERFTGDGYGSEKVAEITYRVEGKRLMMAVPRTALKADGGTLRFTWTDNVHDEADTGVQGADGRWRYSRFSGDIMDFYISGDVAPGGRFRYQYKW